MLKYNIVEMDAKNFQKNLRLITFEKKYLILLF